MIKKPSVKKLLTLSGLLLAYTASAIDKPITLDFQKIPLSQALAVYADFTGLNIVSDSKLDELIDIDLKGVKSSTFLALLTDLYDLHVDQQDGVLLVMKRTEYETRHQAKQVKIVPVLYSSAENLVSQLGKRQNQNNQNNGQTIQPFITFDSRTNSVILEGTQDFIDRNAKIIKSLDIPAKTVSISARLVSIASDDLTNLGRKLSTSLATTGQNTQSASLFADMAVLATSGYSLALGKVGNYLLDLEFQALKEKGKIEIVSRPSLVTLNNNRARISQGLQIPFQIQDPNGSFHTEFKDAALTLEVTPRYIDGAIFLDVFLSKDNPGQTVAAGTTIEKRQLHTSVQVKPGDTVVLGGIREHIDSNTKNTVPFFEGIPVLDYLFSSTESAINAKELVIFLTPSLIN